MWTRQEYEERYAELKIERTSHWDAHWKELQENLLPRRGRFYLSETNRGNKKNQKIYDNTALLALRTLASGMMAGLTSPARPWFRLTTADPQQSSMSSVRQWLTTVQRLMLEAFARSNVYQVLQVGYEELGGFGTCCLIMEEDADTIVRMYPMTVGEYVLDQDDRLQVDTMFREQRYTVRQVVEWFGIDNVSETTRQSYNSKEYTKTVDVLHVVHPNENYREGVIGPDGMKHNSVYIERGAREKDKEFLRAGGFNELAIFGARWAVTGVDVYGRGPGMDALGDVKQMYSMVKTKGKAIQKMVDPPLMAPESLRRKKINTLPNGVTYVDVTSSMQGMKSVYDVRPDLSAFIEDFVDIRHRISRAFYEDLFLMMTQSTRRQITAREVEERHAEKMLMLGPVLERLKAELLDPMIDRTYAIMERKGMIPAPPPELEGQEVRIELISMLAQAQKGVALQGMEYFLAQVGGVAGMDPGALDKVDFDQYIDEMAEALGVPPSIINDDAVVEFQRSQRQRMQAMQQATEMAQGAARAAKDASAVDTSEGGTLATDVLTGLTAAAAGQ